MKNIISAAALLFTLLAFGQSEEPIKVIAKRIAPAQCDKMCIARYSILKNVQGTASNTIIEIGCQPDKRVDNAPETALLTIIPTKLKDYYIGCGFAWKGTVSPADSPTMPAHYRGIQLGLFELDLDVVRE